MSKDAWQQFEAHLSTSQEAVDTLKKARVDKLMVFQEQAYWLALHPSSDQQGFQIIAE